MHDLNILTGIIIALLVEISLLKFMSRRIGSSYLIVLIVVTLLVILCWISVYFTKVEILDEKNLSLNGSIFTIIGAIFTAVNTVIVIYLMLWLHHKESKTTLFPRFQELQVN